MMPPILWRRIVAVLLMVVAIPGCAKLLTDAPKPLFRVTATRTFPADLPHVSAQLLIDVPLAAGALDTSRIALANSPVDLNYFADGEWTDPAPRLVQTVLLESFENSGAVTAIDRETIGIRADFVLKSELRHFEAVYDKPNAPPQIWVALNVRLVKMPERSIVAQTLIEQNQQASANNIQQIVLAFDAALSGATKQIVAWTVTNPALSKRRAALLWSRFVHVMASGGGG
jgi:cholesterol transport system auxiliary component